MYHHQQQPARSSPQPGELSRRCKQWPSRLCRRVLLYTRPPASLELALRAREIGGGGNAGTLRLLVVLVATVAHKTRVRRLAPPAALLGVVVSKHALF